MSRLSELAIVALESEGLIKPDGNGGWVFTKSQPISVIDLTNVRTEVEYSAKVAVKDGRIVTIDGPRARP